MTREQQEATAPLIERTEMILNRSGERLGRLVGRTGARIQRATQGVRAEADHADELKPATRQRGKEATAAPQERQPTAERAEAMVDQFGQRVNQWMTRSGLQARRAVARLQEEAEDMWVEAHAMRSSWKGEPIQR